MHDDASRGGGGAGGLPRRRGPHGVNHCGNPLRHLFEDVAPENLPQPLPPGRVALDDLDLGASLGPQAQGGRQADGPAADDCGAGRAVALNGRQREARRVPGDGDRLGQRRPLERDVAGHLDQIALGDADVFGEGSLARRHRDDLAVRTDVLPARFAGRAGAAGHERVDGHAGSVERAAADRASGFVAEHQRRRAPGVVAEIGVHVGAAYAGCRDSHEALGFGGAGIGKLADLEPPGFLVDEGLHGSAPFAAVSFRTSARAATGRSAGRRTPAPVRTAGSP